MKITFPRIGDSHMYGRLLFQELGVDIVIPAPNSTEGLEKGSTISPEDICLPFKIMAGNLLSAWESGADTVIMPATMGPCRLGEYGELLSVILKKHGCDYEWILLDSISAIGAKQLLTRLEGIVGDSRCNKIQILSALSKTYKLIVGFESLEDKVRRYNTSGKEKYLKKAILRECRSGIDEAVNLADALQVVKRCGRKLDVLRKQDLLNNSSEQPLRLLLTGEIYTLIDSFGNHHIENTLLDLGVAFEKNITIGWWIHNTIINPFGGIISEVRNNPFMPYRIGGYAKETINDAVRCIKEDFDGIIQLFPVGCMPEIVAKSVLDEMAKKEGVPVLTIIYDEMEGEAGYLTRIEAFTDMLSRKKERENVLSGNRCGVGKH